MFIRLYKPMDYILVSVIIRFTSVTVNVKFTACWHSSALRRASVPATEDRVSAIIVIAVTPVINDSEDPSFDCYVLYLIITRWTGLCRMAEKSGVRWPTPFIRRAFKCLSSFQLRAAFLSGFVRVALLFQ